jgi:hypothetical protein
MGTVVLNFGSSVLRPPGDLHVGVDEISPVARWLPSARRRFCVRGVTNQLLSEVIDLLGADCSEATAAYVATGEQRTAALLMGSSQKSRFPRE